MRRSHEPVAWSLFGAGGMMLAFLGPGLIVVTAVLGIASADDPKAMYQHVSLWLAHPVCKLALLAFVSLSLYHALHRMYHGLHDLHVRLPRMLMLLVFYGGASALSAIAGVLLLAV